MDETLKGRIMCLDFGSKTVGVAVTDELGMTAQGVCIIRREKANKLRSTMRELEELIQKFRPVLIVLGLPLNMDGSSGFRVEATRAFGDKVAEKFGIPVHYTDERLSTVEAIEIMDESNISKEDRYLYVDKIAAVIILERYLKDKH